MPDNPLGALGKAIKDAALAANRKMWDEIFVFIDPNESPLTASIRKQGDEAKDILRGIVITLGELEKRLPPTKDQAA